MAGRPLLVVDPLDGSYNLPPVRARSAACRSRSAPGEGDRGARYDFNRDELYVGSGLGLQVNGEPVERLYARRDPRRPACRYALDFSDKDFAQVATLIRSFKKVRDDRFGRAVARLGREPAASTSTRRPASAGWDVAGGLGARREAAGGTWTAVEPIDPARSRCVVRSR